MLTRPRRASQVAISPPGAPVFLLPIALAALAGTIARSVAQPLTAGAAFTLRNSTARNAVLAVQSATEPSGRWILTSSDCHLSPGR